WASTYSQYSVNTRSRWVLPFCRATIASTRRNRGRPSGNSSPAWTISHSCHGVSGWPSTSRAKVATSYPIVVSGVSSRSGGVHILGSVLPSKPPSAEFIERAGRLLIVTSLFRRRRGVHSQAERSQDGQELRCALGLPVIESFGECPTEFDCRLVRLPHVPSRFVRLLERFPDFLLVVTALSLIVVCFAPREKK